MIQFTKLNQIKQTTQKLEKITKIISGIRFLLAIHWIVWLVCLFTLENYSLYGSISAVSFVLLIGFCLFGNRYFKKYNLSKKKEMVYQSHEKRRNLDFTMAIDDGRDFLNKEDYKLVDLDIFGSKSLFQYLNVCKTKLGREALAKQLSQPMDKGLDFTQCIYHLSEEEDTLMLEAGLLEFDDSAKRLNYEELNSVLTTKIQFNPLFILPLLSFIGMWIYFILIFVEGLSPFGLIGFGIANFILCRFCLKNDIYHLDSFRYYTFCDAYYNLAKLVLETEIKDNFYKEKQEVITRNLDSLRKIKRVYLALSTRRNILANILLNVCFLYDFWLIFLFNRLSSPAQNLDNLFETIAELEVMTSFSVIGLDNEIYCVPSKNKEYIQGSQIYHPLVKNCVTNDFLLQGGVILTGSNMSGKTTFMRMLGINQILCNAGSIVCAKEYNSSLFPIYTSLRANDMLSEGISTFYAEILRMKKMNEAIREQRCFILIDEIFKGTNAYERLEASFKIIEKLNERHILFIISTHDFELCEAKGIQNYHFNEHYVGDKIEFDYKIKEGMCESTNALYLLKMFGIL